MYRSWCRNDGNHQHCRRFLSDVDGLGSVLHVCVVAVSGAVVRLQQLVQHTVSVSIDYVLPRLSRINMFLSCLPRNAMHSAAYAVVRCLSVCLSRSCIEHILKLYLNLSKQYSARRLLSELPRQRLETTGNLLNRSARRATRQR